MNRLTLATVLLLTSSPALAAYSIDYEAQVNSEKPGSGTVVLNSGRENQVSYGDTTLKFTAHQRDPNSVEINVQIFKRAGRKLTLISAPRVVTMMNMTATITTSSGNGKGVRLQVKAHETP